MAGYPPNYDYSGGYNQQPPPPGMCYPPGPQQQPQPYYPPPGMQPGMQQPQILQPGPYYPQQPPTQTIVVHEKPQKKDNCLRDCCLCALCMTLCCWCCTD